MQLHRMLAQPLPPGQVVGSAGGDQAPEPRTVPEVAQVGQLVDDDRIERFGRGEDEAPGERQPALARGAPPARLGVANRDRRRFDAELLGLPDAAAVDRAARPNLQAINPDRAYVLAAFAADGDDVL